MNMQKFCHNCGKQVVVGAKFCNECGTSLSSLANSPTPAPTAKPTTTARPGQFTPFAVGRDDDDDDSYLDRLEHVEIRQSELQVEIVKDRPLGESVGALVAQALQGAAPISEPARPAQYTNNEVFLKDFRQEAGTSRRENQPQNPTS